MPTATAAPAFVLVRPGVDCRWFDEEGVLLDVRGPLDPPPPGAQVIELPLVEIGWGGEPRCGPSRDAEKFTGVVYPPARVRGPGARP